MVSDRPVVILTGASAGIGLATLEALTPDTQVIAISRTRPPLAHTNCHWLQGDLRFAERVASTIAEYLQARSLVPDGLIFCAGSYGKPPRHSLLETSDAEWDELHAVNARSQFVLALRLLPLLLQRPNAFVVGISSDAAVIPAPGRVAYGCSKAASHALFAGLAAELRDTTVAVIQLRPAGQVVTRGIRQRRASDHDFADYDQPQIFREPMRRIVLTRGAGMNGATLVVP